MSSSSASLFQITKKEQNTFVEVGASPRRMQLNTVSTPSTADLTSFSDISSSNYGKDDSNSENSRHTYVEPSSQKLLKRRLQFDEYKNDNGVASTSFDTLSWSWKEKNFNTPTRFGHERKSLIECNESPIAPNDMIFIDTSFSSYLSDTSSFETLSYERNNMNVSTVSKRLRDSNLSFPCFLSKYMLQNSDGRVRFSKPFKTSSSRWLRAVACLIILHTCFSIFLLVRIERLSYLQSDGAWPHPLLRRHRKNLLERVADTNSQSFESFKTQNNNLMFTKTIEGLAPLFLSNPQLNEKFGQVYHRERLGFSSLDSNMYSFIQVKAQLGSYPRIFSLGDIELNVYRPRSRVLDVEKTPFTDNTQLYGLRDSGDEALSRMESASRDNDTDGECFSEPWHHEYQPSCNSFHELYMVNIDGAQHGGKLTLFPKQGFWRNAWKVEFPFSNDVAILKTAKYSHNFEARFYETDRVDALAMSRLTFSPHVMNIYSFCARSVMTEIASNIRLGTLADKARKKPLNRLRIAADLAQGLADVHFGKNGNEAEFVHLDINPNNVVVVGNRLKINDFNIGVMLKKNATSGERCAFPTPPYPNAQWRSPEEVNDSMELTEKVDVFSMGHLFYRILVGHEPWNHVEPGGKPSREKLKEKVKNGKLPFIPKQIKESKNPETQAIYSAMMMCYTVNVQDRPSSQDVSRFLRHRLQLLESKYSLASS